MVVLHSMWSMTQVQIDKPSLNASVSAALPENIYLFGMTVKRESPVCLTSLEGNENEMNS